ncbi:amidohydrolase family protein, partial [uncultured Demequina sp.]|uniref:amidohydrolase family protein n=1 Tax=uncultured Demequina sp. TaxID=693499 RepID=UPI0025EB3094
MIIDCHGHYTTAPAAHTQWREAQLAAWAAGTAAPEYPHITDDEIRETIESNQLRLIRERGADVTIFSPRASAMGHHLGDLDTSIAWTAACNDLIGRVVDLFPETFVGVAQLPQAAGAPLDAAVRELEARV